MKHSFRGVDVINRFYPPREEEKYDGQKVVPIVRRDE